MSGLGVFSALTLATASSSREPSGQRHSELKTKEDQGIEDQGIEDQDISGVGFARRPDPPASPAGLAVDDNVPEAISCQIHARVHKTVKWP
jgi:hypothetical protein